MAAQIIHRTAIIQPVSYTHLDVYKRQDPMQTQIFAMMPWFFAFIFGSFASGLVIYYTWSNLLTIVQQYVIAKQTGSPTVFDEWFKKQEAKKTVKSVSYTHLDVYKRQAMRRLIAMQR